MTDFTEAFSYKLLKGIMIYSKAHKPWVVCRMPPSYKDEFGIEGVIKWAQSWKADAIIGRFNNNDKVELFKENHIVAVAQDYKSRFTCIPNITGNYKQTGRMAAEFFLSKGYKSFAFYGYDDAIWSKERCEGFYNYLAEQGMAEHFYTYNEQSSDNLWFSNTAPLLEWLESLPQPTALMTCDDNLGNHITEICMVNQIKVPERIAILGVDNDEVICNLSAPPLSSISQDVVKGGYQAAELIDHILHGQSKETTPGDIVLEPICVIDRLSTNHYPTSDPHIHTVLKYIHNNLSSNICVSEIVKIVPLSRRLLEIRFKNATGQSIHKYIFNLKMEKFARLLIETEEPISNLALEIGISNLKNLSRQFKSLKKVSPAQFRKEYRTTMKNRN